MRRMHFALIPAFIAAVALTLGSTPIAAQEGHNHDTPAGGSAGRACCQKSGGTAANHAAAQDSAPAADAVDGDPVDDAAMGDAAQGAAGGCCASMKHDAGGGCCAGMAMNHGTATDTATGGAGCACCAKMAVKAAPAPEDHTNHGAAPDGSAFAMPGMAGCGAAKTTANDAIDPFAEDPSVTE